MSNVLELLYDYCRICLDNIGGKNLFSDAALLANLETCTGVLYPNTAGLSQVICDKCENKLKIVSEFRNLAIINQNKLQSLQSETGDQEVDENGVKSCLTNLDNVKMETITAKPSISVRTDIFKREKSPEDPGEVLPKQSKKYRFINPSDNKCEKSPEDPGEVLPKQSKKYRFINPSDNKCEKSPEDPGEVLPKQSKKYRFINPSDNKCETCNKIFTSKKSLNLHKRIHSAEKSHPCPVCCKVFPTSSDYKKHALVHTGVKPFECDVCQRAFSQKVTLKKHKETIHNFQPYE